MKNNGEEYCSSVKVRAPGRQTSWALWTILHHHWSRSNNLVFSLNAPQHTINVMVVRVGRVESHLQSHLIITLKPSPHPTPSSPLPLHSRLLPTCLLCRYYSRYKIHTYTSATSQTGCSHDFLVPNNDARWPELPDNVAHIYFINDDIFQYSRVIVSKFYAFLVFSFTN